MILEREAYDFLIIFFVGVILLASVCLICSYFKTRNRHLLWFAGQVVCLIVSFYYFYICVLNRPDPQFSMYSEEQSITLARAGIWWMFSMLFEVVGFSKCMCKNKTFPE